MKRLKVVQDRTKLQFFAEGIKFSTSIKARKLLTGRLTVRFQEGLCSIWFQRQNKREVPNPDILEHVKSEGEFFPVLNSALRNEGVWRNWGKARRILNHGTRWWCIFSCMTGSLLPWGRVFSAHWIRDWMWPSGCPTLWRKLLPLPAIWMRFLCHPSVT